MNWRNVLIFAGLVLGLLYLTKLLIPVLTVLTLIFVGFLFFKIFLRKYEPYESALIYRFGRIHRVSPSGWTIVLPIIEKVGAVLDLRERKEELPIKIITAEGLKMDLRALVYFYISNAKKAVLNVQNYRQALLNLVESVVRDLSAEFSFTQLLINVEQVSEMLKKRINQSLENWGLTLTTFEIEKIAPPQEVMDAIRGKRVAAENLETQKFVAEARRVITRALGEGTRSFDDKTISYLYIKALENMKSAKMMLPAEFLNVMHREGGGSKSSGGSLAGSMIAGTTFNKALSMIGDEIKKDAFMHDDHIQDKMGDESGAAENVSETTREEDAGAMFDMLDGTPDGGLNEDQNDQSE